MYTRLSLRSIPFPLFLGVTPQCWGTKRSVVPSVAEIVNAVGVVASLTTVCRDVTIRDCFGTLSACKSNRYDIIIRVTKVKTIHVFDIVRLF